MIYPAPPPASVTRAAQIRFRCSSLGHIMSEPREKKWREALAAGDFNALPKGCKKHLTDVYASAVLGRRSESSGRAQEKGTLREQDSITLISRVMRTMFKKNTERLQNEFIEGEPDLFTGPNIRNADATLDAKSSWSVNTFLHAMVEDLNADYKWQGHGYMALTGAQEHSVVYCLVNGLAGMIVDEKRRLGYAMGVIDDMQNEEYLDKCRQIEINHIFDIKEFMRENPYFQLDNAAGLWKWDIPRHRRVFSKTFFRDDEMIERIYRRVEVCWAWMDHHLFKMQ